MGRELFRALLSEKTFWLLAFGLVEVVGVLAWVAILILAARQEQQEDGQVLHIPNFPKTASMIRSAM